jgi:HAD superfamily hydrolase (TIGR01509 family)
MNQTAVVFDLDGVVLDAKELHKRCFIEACRMGAGLVIDDEFHEKHLEALSTKQKISKLLDMKLIKDENEAREVSFKKQDLTVAHIPSAPLTVSWMQSIFSHIKEQGFGLALCSNSVRLTCMTALQSHDLLKYFDLVISNEDVSWQKPSPAPYLMVASMMNTVPSKLIVFEDSVVGISSALAAGCIVTPVFDPKHDLDLERIQKWLKCVAV